MRKKKDAVFQAPSSLTIVSAAIIGYDIASRAISPITINGILHNPTPGLAMQYITFTPITKLQDEINQK